MTVELINKSIRNNAALYLIQLPATEGVWTAPVNTFGFNKLTPMSAKLKNPNLGLDLHFRWETSADGETWAGYEESNFANEILSQADGWHHLAGPILANIYHVVAPYIRFTAVSANVGLGIPDSTGKYFYLYCL